MFETCSRQGTVRIVGNSMNLAGLVDGMEVEARQADVAHDGDLVVVRQPDGTHIVKRYRERRGVASLVPESSDPRWRPRRMGEGDRIVAIVPEVPLAAEMAELRRELLGLDPFVVRGSHLREPLVPRATDAQWRDDAPRNTPLAGPPKASRAAVVETFRTAPPPPGGVPRDPFAYDPWRPWLPGGRSRYPVPRSRPAPHRRWATFAGVVGEYAAIDPASPRRVWAAAHLVPCASFCVVQAGQGMTGRGVFPGDLLYVQPLPRRLFAAGIVVITDLGEDWGAVCGELHGDGRRLWVRSSTGRPVGEEMCVAIEHRGVLGYVVQAEGMD